MTEPLTTDQERAELLAHGQSRAAGLAIDPLPVVRLFTPDAHATWLLASLDPAIPYHLARFFPCHRMLDRPPTPVSALHALADVARRHLSDVLLGNC